MLYRWVAYYIGWHIVVLFAVWWMFGRG